MFKHSRIGLKTVSLLSLMSVSSTALSQIEVDTPEFGPTDSWVFLQRLTDGIPGLLTGIVENGAYIAITLSLFLFCATIFLVLALKEYMFAGDARRMLESVLAVAVIWILIDNYEIGLWALYGWQEDFGSMVQFAVLGTTNKYQAIETVVSIYDRFEFNVFSGSLNPIMIFARLWSDIVFFFFIGGFFIILFLLILGVAVASLFSLWGFLIVGIIGPMLMPLALFPQLRFMFEGWVRTLFTVLLYSVIARFVLSICVWGFDLLLGAPTGSGSDFTQSVIVITGRDWGALIGCIIWAASCIAAIGSVMNYAQSIVSGVGAAMGDGKAAGKLASLLPK
ncbi:MAG: type IV secretion system protein [Pseudohongiella sp.]|nr:type IV secretion system protein [Pseudohongiella sp.]